MTDEKVGGCVSQHHKGDEFEIIELSLRVLVYRDEDENGKWAALALEMDLRGYGDDPDAALNELREAVEAQVSFALFNNDPSMINFPAEKKYFEVFDKVHSKSISAIIFGDMAPANASGPPDYYARSLKIPDPHVIAAMKAGDCWAHA